MIITSLVIFLVYILVVYKYFGIPYSISDTYYKWEKKKRGLGWLFSAMCILVGGLLLPPLLELTPITYQFCAFLACAGLIFVGAAPQFKLQLTGAVHYSAAAVCVIFSQIWVGLTCWFILIPVWLTYIIYTLIEINNYSTGSLWLNFVETKPMLWCEIAALAATYLTILIVL